MVRKFIVSTVAFLMAIAVSAQDEPEYRLELGAGAGLAAYEGDFNGNILKGMKPMGTAVAKYKMNPRMAWAALIGYGKLKGSSTNADTWLPELNNHPVSFNTSVVDVTLRYEYNFWPFGTGREYYGATRITPFITLGVGMSFGSAEATKDGNTEKVSSVGFQFPIGLGMKYKLADRWNLAVEWTMHFTGTDKLDGKADPYGIKSSGLFKNTDCYSILGATLTYDLWAKCKTCHNDRE